MPDQPRPTNSFDALAAKALDDIGSGLRSSAAGRAIIGDLGSRSLGSWPILILLANSH
jgi:hypothetical protein